MREIWRSPEVELWLKEGNPWLGVALQETSNTPFDPSAVLALAEGKAYDDRTPQQHLEHMKQQAKWQIKAGEVAKWFGVLFEQQNSADAIREAAPPAAPLRAGPR